MARTIDGLRIPRIAMKMEEWGISVREGTKHPYIANYPNMRPCPIAESTHAERMLTPWISQALGRDKREIYTELRNDC